MVEPHKSGAGTLLYRQLPEEYRYRDNRTEAEQGDLESYLDGFGYFLDRVRETLEQAYGDAFAETADNGRTIQDWLVPYLADLLQAELLSPDPRKRPDELNNTVGWYKSKGTLQTVDGIADTVAGAETIVVEGWKRTLIAPRVSLPPFTMPPDQPGRVGPLGTPDLRFNDRAVIDPEGQNQLEKFSLPGRDANGHPTLTTIFWKQRALGGAPCFPGHFDDRMVRTPDVGDISRRRAGPHPRRVHVHVQPPSGLFEKDLKTFALNGADPLLIAAHVAAHGTEQFVIDPEEIYRQQGLGGEVPDKLVLAGDLAIPANANVLVRDLLFMDRISVARDGRLEMRRGTARRMSLAKAGETPMLSAHDCLFGEIVGSASFALLEYVTVMGTTTLGRMQASDCIFVGDLVDFDCAAKTSCVRYSRLPETVAGACAKAGHPNNTTARPTFVELVFGDPDGVCRVRTAAYGEPGCGVLASGCAPSITAGAEDRGEMGAHHHLFHAAKLRAIRTKLGDFLPVGQTIALEYDERLSVPPPRVGN